MRFFGYNIADNLNIIQALNTVYGISNNTSYKLCREIGISDRFIASDLTEEQLFEIRKWVETNKLIELELKKLNDVSLQRLSSINCYKGIRHRMGLPVRGQRTHSNGRTQKKRKLKLSK